MNEDLSSSPAPELSEIRAYPTKRRFNIVFVLLAVLVVVGISVAIVVVLRNRTGGASVPAGNSSEAGNSQNRLEDMETGWREYRASNFSFQYPDQLVAKQTERGVSVNKQNSDEGVFILGTSSVSTTLKEVVDIKQKENGGGGISVMTLGSYSGYSYKTANAYYYYFPLGVESYLSVIINKPDELGDGTINNFLSSLKLSPATSE